MASERNLESKHCRNSYRSWDHNYTNYSLLWSQMTRNVVCFVLDFIVHYFIRIRHYFFLTQFSNSSLILRYKRINSLTVRNDLNKYRYFRLWNRNFQNSQLRYKINSTVVVKSLDEITMISPSIEHLSPTWTTNQRNKWIYVNSYRPLLPRQYSYRMYFQVSLNERFIHDIRLEINKYIRSNVQTRNSTY